MFLRVQFSFAYNISLSSHHVCYHSHCSKQQKDNGDGEKDTGSAHIFVVSAEKETAGHGVTCANLIHDASINIVFDSQAVVIGRQRTTSFLGTHNAVGAIATTPALAARNVHIIIVTDPRGRRSILGNVMVNFKFFIVDGHLVKMTTLQQISIQKTRSTLSSELITGMQIWRCS